MRAAIVACSTDEDSATRGAKSELCQWDATAGGQLLYYKNHLQPFGKKVARSTDKVCAVRDAISAGNKNSLNGRAAKRLKQSNCN